MDSKDTSNTLNGRALYISAALFVVIIAASNYLVSFNVMGTYITYGALTYPLSFLLMDVLVERYGRKQAMRPLTIGIVLAFFISLLVADSYRIAFASIGAFALSQMLDMYVFSKLKERYPSLWWLRSGVSTGIAQGLDTFAFFHIAFLFVLPYYDVFMLFLFDYGVKVAIGLVDLPLFYLLAIKAYKKNRLSS